MFRERIHFLFFLISTVHAFETDDRSLTPTLVAAVAPPALRLYNPNFLLLRPILLKASNPFSFTVV